MEVPTVPANSSPNHPVSGHPVGCGSPAPLRCSRAIPTQCRTYEPRLSLGLRCPSPSPSGLCPLQLSSSNPPSCTHTLALPAQFSLCTSPPLESLQGLFIFPLSPLLRWRSPFSNLILSPSPLPCLFPVLYPSVPLSSLSVSMRTTILD